MVSSPVTFEKIRVCGETSYNIPFLNTFSRFSTVSILIWPYASET